jgi:hypothetical protein
VVDPLRLSLATGVRSKMDALPATGTSPSAVLRTEGEAGPGA